MKNWNCEPRKQVSETKTCQSVHWVVYLNLKMAVVIGEACQVQILVLSDHGYFKSSLTVGVFVGLLSSCKSKNEIAACDYRTKCVVVWNVIFLLSLVAPGDCHCWSCVEFDCCLNSKKMTTSTMCST